MTPPLGTSLLVLLVHAVGSTKDVVFSEKLLGEEVVKLGLRLSAALGRRLVGSRAWEESVAGCTVVGDGTDERPGQVLVPPELVSVDTLRISCSTLTRYPGQASQRRSPSPS